MSFFWLTNIDQFVAIKDKEWIPSAVHEIIIAWLTSFTDIVSSRNVAMATISFGPGHSVVTDNSPLCWVHQPNLYIQLRIAIQLQGAGLCQGRQPHRVRQTHQEGPGSGQADPEAWVAVSSSSSDIRRSILQYHPQHVGTRIPLTRNSVRNDKQL